MNSIEVLAPAKVNLFLKVLNKRRDSYHDIFTLFERISLADKIKISKIADNVILSSDKKITADPKDNIAYKAARLLMKHKRLKAGVKIVIKKNIPIAAGLGGGSSDAAAVLTGMNRLFNLRMRKDVLARLAAKLGADVPFFVLDTPFAIGSSRGDKLRIVRSKRRFWHLLIWPGFELSTKHIYNAFDAKDLTRRPSNAKIRFSSRDLMDFDVLEAMLYNDLEDIIKDKYKVIKVIIDRLAYFLGKKAILSGSGPSLFCLCRTRKEAIAARNRFSKLVPARTKRPWRVFVAETMD